MNQKTGADHLMMRLAAFIVNKRKAFLVLFLTNLIQGRAAKRAGER